jgi:hypothetical protein
MKSLLIERERERERERESDGVVAGCLCVGLLEGMQSEQTTREIQRLVWPSAPECITRSTKKAHMNQSAKEEFTSQALGIGICRFWPYLIRFTESEAKVGERPNESYGSGGNSRHFEAFRPLARFGFWSVGEAQH